MKYIIPTFYTFEVVEEAQQTRTNLGSHTTFFMMMKLYLIHIQIPFLLLEPLTQCNTSKICSLYFTLSNVTINQYLCNNLQKILKNSDIEF